MRSGGALMGDPELAAVSRYKLESQELLRSYRSLAWQLEVVDRELEQGSHRDRKEQLHVRRMRITESLAATKARLRACRDRCDSKARRVSPHPEES
jgi:LPS O-antigen subunit length determinant protein (WzzB/FepE family)